MADVIFTAQERKGLSEKDLAMLHEHVLHHIQTSQEIRRLISRQRKEFVELHADIKKTLKRKARPLLERLKQQATPGAGRKKKKKKKK